VVRWDGTLPEPHRTCGYREDNLLDFKGFKPRREPLFGAVRPIRGG
jgi:hypothetical protein